MIRRVALPLAVLGDAGRGDAGVRRLGERMMARHGVMLATFRAAGAASPHLAAEDHHFVILAPDPAGHPECPAVE